MLEDIKISMRLALILMLLFLCDLEIFNLSLINLFRYPFMPRNLTTIKIILSLWVAMLILVQLIQNTSSANRLLFRKYQNFKLQYSPLAKLLGICPSLPQLHKATFMPSQWKDHYTEISMMSTQYTHHKTLVNCHMY